MFESVGKSFPNYFSDLHALEASNRDIKLVEKYIQSVIDRLLIPHIYEANVENTDFFKHLVAKAREFAKQTNEDIELDLYIGGGVVRTLLANMYKFIYESQPAPELNRKSITELDDSYSRLEANSAAEYQKIIKGSELRLHGINFVKQPSLLSPFVLGVGSDLDIYYEVKLKPGQEKLSEQQIAAGKEVAKKLVDYISALEIQNELRKADDPIKHSLLPIPDVKEYHSQIDRVLKQGGSMLDTLAFKLNAKPGENKLKHPERYAKNNQVIRDFLHGVYEYLAPEDEGGKASQKQTIRGVRILFEAPFLTEKDKRVLERELLDIIDHLKQNKPLADDAIQQFHKLLRNSLLSGAKNRAYSDNSSTAGLVLKIADLIKENFKLMDMGNKIKHLLPKFIQQMPIDSYEAKIRTCKGELYNKLQQEMIPVNAFIANCTNDGSVQHGTSLEAGMNILRGGFVESSKETGAAAFGPGLYTSNSFDLVKEYAGETGLVLPLTINKNTDLVIIKRSFITENFQSLLEEAIAKGFRINKCSDEQAVYNLLRDRKQYAVDIVLAAEDIFVLQNQEALIVDKDLTFILNWCNARFTAQPNIETFRELENICNILKQLGITIPEYIKPEQVLLKLNTEFLDQFLSPSLQKSINWDIAKLLFVADSYNFLDKLLENNVDLNMHADDDQSLLLCALKAKNYNAAKKILSKLTIISDCKSQTLRFAIESDDPEIYQMVLELRKEGLEQGDYMGYAPIHLCSIAGKTEIVEYLLNQKVNVNKLSITGCNAVNLAVTWDHIEVLKLLIARGANLDVRPGHGAFYKTPLVNAIECDQIEIATLLINSGADLNLEVYSDTTPLLIAVQRGNKEVVEAILTRKANPVYLEQTNIFNESALTLALKYKHYDIACMLVAHGAANYINDQYSLIGIANYGNQQFMQALQARGFDISALLEYCTGNFEKFQQLLDLGAKFPTENSVRLGWLYRAINNGNDKMANLIIDQGVILPKKESKPKPKSKSSSYLSYGFEEEKSLLRLALRKCGKETVRKLINIGVDINERSHSGETLLMLASYEIKSKSKLLLIELGADLGIRDDRGKSTLMYACEQGDIAVVQAILNKLPNKEAELNYSCYCDSALSVATRRGSKELIELLIINGAKVKDLDKAEKSGLHQAANWGNTEVVKLLLDYGADINALDSLVFTPLIRAMGKFSNLETARLLLEMGADLNLADYSGKTALMAAAESKHGQELIVEMVARGADVYHKDEQGKSALDYICEHCRPDIMQQVKELLAKNPRVSASKPVAVANVNMGEVGQGPNILQSARARRLENRNKRKSEANDPDQDSSKRNRATYGTGTKRNK